MSSSINLPEANEITLFSGWARTDAAVADSATAHRCAQDNKLLHPSAQYRKCGLSAERERERQGQCLAFHGVHMEQACAVSIGNVYLEYR